jgi:hypothetical protein
VLLATIVVLGLRQPQQLLTPQFWAEDAAIFYPEAEFVGAGALLRP